MNTHHQGGVALGEHRPDARIEVRKHSLDVRCGGDVRRRANDAAGFAKLSAMLAVAHADLAVLEATGPYERSTLCALQVAGDRWLA